MRRRILFLLVIMSALAVRAYEKIPLRLDYDRDIYGETVRDDRSLSMCVSACRNRRGSRCPEAIPSCLKGMLKGRCP